MQRGIKDSAAPRREGLKPMAFAGKVNQQHGGGRGKFYLQSLESQTKTAEQMGEGRKALKERENAKHENSQILLKKIRKTTRMRENKKE